MYTLDAKSLDRPQKTTAPLGEYQERGCREGEGEVLRCLSLPDLTLL